MPWFKVDDQLHSHPKWRVLSKPARALWTTAGSWAAAQPDDGYIPGFMLAALDGKPREAAELVSAGLWKPEVEGWRFHDWLEFQPSAAQVKRGRAEARERMRRLRERKGNKS